MACLRYIILFLCCFRFTAGFSQPADSLRLPPELARKAAALQKENNLGEWLYLQMDYAAEEPAERLSLLMNLGKRAWRAPQNETEHSAWLDMLTYQGYYQMFTGNILPSITAYEAAYNYYNEQKLTDPDILEYILKPLGNNYTRLGDYERAGFIQERSLDIAQKQKDPLQTAAVYSNLAVTCLMQERFDLAGAHAQSGLRVAPANSSVTGLLHSSLAEIYIRKKMPDSAAIHAALGIRILQQPQILKTENAGYWLASVLQANGDVAMLKKQYGEAEKWDERSLAVLNKFYPDARNREKARVLVKQGRAALQKEYAQPRYNSLLQPFDRALRYMLPAHTSGWPAKEKLYGDFTIADAIEGRADALVRAGRLKEALEGYQLIFDIEATLRREFFSRATRLLHQRQSHALAEKAMNAAYLLWEQGKQEKYAWAMLHIMEKSKAQVLLQEQVFNRQQSRLGMKDPLLDEQQRMQQALAYYDRETAVSGKKNAARDELAYNLSQLQVRIRKKYPDYFEPVRENSLHSEKDIPAGLTVKSLFSGEDHLYVVDITSAGIQSVRRLDDGEGKQSFLQHFVTTYFHNGPAAMQNSPAAYYRDAYQVYQWLWNGPVAPRYLLIPDGWFGYLPFDALITDSTYKRNTAQWPFLLNQTVTSLAYSLQTYRQQSPAAGENDAKLTGFFISAVGLPAVEEEYKAIKEAAAGLYFKDNKATLAAFREQLGHGGILHLSTHASLEGDQQLPAIQLADGPFYLFELYTRKFRPGLIVLSACRTGQGMMAEGEGIISLAREFTTSGATGIVAGLWNLHDATAANLTGDFYKELRNAADPAMALHSAKQQWLRNGKASQQLKLPYYWAAMTYIGHPQTVVPEKPVGNKMWYWILGAGVLLVVVVGFRRSRR
ncbi:CHAT domain-containing protein [Chitinophaga barathri]|uniref:CHAT domain-containing protein n=1 Tax=Chitinophaga barathri TaxID=1647451 RepID=A0A3N4MLZ6_9BACT|nr:CHAT domain-containing protein [Chitinophaga barathri]RPD41080.1 CHAT domain-containing protein [Chitinophaga barathri]